MSRSNNWVVWTLLIINLILVAGVISLEIKVNQINNRVKSVSQDITCGEALVNGPNGNSCIGLKTQLDELLDKQN